MHGQMMSTNVNVWRGVGKWCPSALRASFEWKIYHS